MFKDVKSTRCWAHVGMGAIVNMPTYVPCRNALLGQGFDRFKQNSCDVNALFFGVRVVRFHDFVCLVVKKKKTQASAQSLGYFCFVDARVGNETEWWPAIESQNFLWHMNISFSPKYSVHSDGILYRRTDRLKIRFGIQNISLRSTDVVLVILNKLGHLRPCIYKKQVAYVLDLHIKPHDVVEIKVRLRLALRVVCV